MGEGIVMNQGLQITDTHTGEIIEATPLGVIRSPEEVLEEAKRAATALKNIISNKKKPVSFNGEQYLEFEDWQTLAKFYGIVAKVTETNHVEYGGVNGFEARAVAIDLRTGTEISAAESLCLNDERNWKSKPLFQLKSMAQTRACAKALRHVLAWVVVLAGYKPTPYEEMSEVKDQISDHKPVLEAGPVEMQVEIQPEVIRECTFGTNRDVKWASMNTKQLRWYKEKIENDLKKPEFSTGYYYYKNQAMLRGIKEVLREE